MQLETVRISRRFQGPPNCSNGGYACGLTAQRLTGAATVRLKAPAPLEADLRLESNEDQARLLHGTSLVAEARRTGLELSPPDPPTFQQATQASESFAGFKQHQFPGCFVCGQQRSAPEGLRIFPGPVPGTSTIAAPWVPDRSLAGPSGHVERVYLWSALDCPSGFALLPLPDDLGIVLGELSVSVAREATPGDAFMVLAWPIGVDGRKRFSGSAIYTADGALVALARATWIDIQLKAWR